MRSYIRNTHIKNNCMGSNATLNGIKWIMHGLHLRKVVKEVVRTCTICAITRALIYHYQSYRGRFVWSVRGETGV